MESITNIKDLDRQMLLNLSDRDILKVCSLNKNYKNKVCDDEFFHRLMLQRYSTATKFKPDNLGWKQYYLQSIYYLEGLKELDEDYAEYSISSPKDLFYSYVNFKDPSTFVFSVAEKGNINLLKKIFPVYLNNIPFDLVVYWALTGAIKENHFEIVKYLMHKYPNYIDKLKKGIPHTIWNNIFKEYKGKDVEILKLLEKLKK